MKSIKEAPIKPGDMVFVRCDLDAPLENGRIGEVFRLNSCLPTLKYILEKGARPKIAGHIGRPGGVFNPLLSTNNLIVFFNQNLGEGNFELLENLRFDAREEIGDIAYTQNLIQGCSLYVNESFATSNRMASSIVLAPSILPSYAGLRLQEEVDSLSKVLSHPKRPLTVIIGGSKIESKMEVITKFLKIADAVLPAGKLGFEWKEKTPHNLRIPVDYIDDKDIGLKTTKEYTQAVKISKTVLWAGPLGMFENDKYSNGTKTLIEALVDVSARGGFVVCGGGDTVSAINKFSSINKMGFVSTGGSAMLLFLAQGNLPGLKALGFEGVL